MKKIGIITINDFNNYGNRLQCYAVQTYLNKLGYETENIYNTGKSRKIIIKEKTKSILKFFLKHNMEAKRLERSKIFKKFNKYISFSKYRIINGKVNADINKEYDYFIVGSDQVWNPNFNTTSDADFLTFVNENDKKISLSASFGVSEIPENKKEYYGKNISKFKALSVREDAGKDIINTLTGRNDVEVLIDPTMMLSDNEWSKIEKKPKQLKDEKFILCYFLGELSLEKKNEIQRIADEKKCKIINILDKTDPFYISGPSEFLYLEKNAELICTDSFHSCVFGILFNTPFLVFERNDKHKSMNSRIDTLLEKFKLEDRKYNGHISSENLKSDFFDTKEILENERNKTINFLIKALG